MSEIGDRYQRVAGAFTDRVRAVPESAWDNPAPCQGWVARDVVRHVVGWMPSLLATVSRTAAEAPPVDQDPVAAWVAVHDAFLAALGDPAVGATEISFGPYPGPFESAADMCRP